MLSTKIKTNLRNMDLEETNFTVRLAESEEDLTAAKRLRYMVFVEELGASASDSDHGQRLETDRFDEWFDHLILIDNRLDRLDSNYVVGSYRLLRGDIAASECGFYSESEFDLSVIKNLGRPVVELGRTCIHPDYRNGSAMFQLWGGLAEYVLKHEIEIMFGVASFHGTNAESLAQPLSYLHHNHLAPEDLRVKAKGEHSVRTDRLPPEKVDRPAAIRDMPTLIKAYLRLGGFIGDGAFVDIDFNTVDVCLLMDTKRMSQRHRDYYVRNRSPD